LPFDSLRAIKSFAQIKVLADQRRLAILRRLMSSPATLTRLGLMLGEHPAWIRHHLKQLEGAGLVELVDAQVSGGFVEKYYRAKARAFLFQEIILPEMPGRQTILIAGSHDLALELLMNPPAKNVDVLSLPVGSLDGLVALRQGLCQVAGCHLLDPENGEYNRPYIRHLFPDRKAALITLAHREQGLLLAPGNPHAVRSLEDALDRNLNLVNRNPGSGTRLWLDQQLQRLGLAPQQVPGYLREVRTHTESAMTILHGSADYGVGLRAAASQVGLDFIPLFEERYDLAVLQDQLDNRWLAPLFDYLVSKEYKTRVQTLGGYDTSQIGQRAGV
jgi:putative molybdopterin biosynthesis protein